MTKYEIVPSKEAHAYELATHMRVPDKQEAWAAMHHSPAMAILYSLEASKNSLTGLADGRVVCMFGVGSATVLSLTGVPWLLATKELENHGRAFIRRNKRELLKMSRGYNLLRNYVDARNLVSIRWLRWLGFTVLPPEPFGVEELPFHPFEMRFHVKPESGV